MPTLKASLQAAVLAVLFPVIALVVLAYALLGARYPRWMVTPDDDTPPFGGYEPTVQAVYARLGHTIGDWYWLGIRNQAYGLKYALKPWEWKHVPSYRHVRFTHTYSALWGVRVISARTTWSTRVLREISVHAFGFVLILGHRVRPIWSSYQQTPWRTVTHPNMDARPVFSLRRGDDSN